MEVTTELPRGLNKAEENCLTIAGLVKKIHYNFLELGGLLLENQEMGFWGASGAESFKTFIQQLGVSYDWATRMMGIAKAIGENLFSQDEVMEIGVAKMCLLLPHIKNGGLPENIRLLAQNSTFNDLRKELGHNLTDNDCDEYVYCPRCGEDFNLLPGMIKRR